MSDNETRHTPVDLQASAAALFQAVADLGRALEAAGEASRKMGEALIAYVNAVEAEIGEGDESRS